VLAEDAAQGVGDLAHGSEAFNRGDHARQQVLARARGLFTRILGSDLIYPPNPLNQLSNRIHPR
jgi:hypothetical protein